MIGAARPFFAQGQWFWSVALLIRGQHQLWSLRRGLQTQLRKYVDFTPDSMKYVRVAMFGSLHVQY